MTKKIVLSLILLLICVLKAFSQSKKKYLEITNVTKIENNNQVFDFYINQILSNGTQINLQTQKTIFSKSIFSIDSKISSIGIIIISEGYKMYSNQYDLNSVIDTLKINILLEKKITDLSEVVVKGDYQRFNIKEDSLIIKIKANDASPHGSLANAFERVPGLSINNGSLEILGKKIESITINGKNYFGGNVQLITDNILTDMVDQLELPNFNNNNHRIKSLNIKLKSNKTNGIYSNVELGFNFATNYLGNISFNKISEKIYLNGFFKTNNVNHQNYFQSNNNFQNNIWEGSSIIESYNSSFMTQMRQMEQPNYILNSNLLNGTNTTTDFGFNFNKSKQNSEMNLLIKGGKLNNNTNNLGIRILNLENIQVVSENNSIIKTNKNSLESNLLFTKKINSRSKLIFLNNSIFNTFDEFLKSKSIINYIPTASIPQDRLTDGESFSNEFANHLQIGYLLSGKSIGVVSSIKLNSRFYVPFLEKSFLNSTKTQNMNFIQNQILDNSSIHGYNHIEFITSKPINKRILLEFRQKNENQQFSTKLSQYSSPEFKKIQSNNIKVNNSIFETQLIFFYLREKLKLYFSPVITVTNQIRMSNNIILKNENNAFFTPIINLIMAKDLKSKFRNSLTFSRSLIMPFMKNLGQLPDSSYLDNINLNNPLLENTIENLVQINSIVPLGDKISTNINLSYTLFDKPIIENIITNTINGSTIRFSVNSAKSANLLNLSLYTTLLKSNKSNLTLNVSLRSFNTFVMNHDSLSNLKNNGIYLSVNNSFKLNSKFNYNSSLMYQFNSVNKLNFSQAILKLKSGYEFNNRFISDINFILNFTTNTRKQMDIQNTVNLSCYHYLGKNNFIRAGLICKNLFGQNLISTNFTSGNEFFTNKMNVMPRTILVSLTFYPEIWK